MTTSVHEGDPSSKRRRIEVEDRDSNAAGDKPVTRALQQLLKMLGHGSEVVRLAAAEALGRIGDESKPAVTELCRLLADEGATRACLARVAEAVGVLGISAVVPRLVDIAVSSRLSDTWPDALTHQGGGQQRGSRSV